MVAAPLVPSRFTILTQIGQGGMATVYLADDAMAQQQVALKVLLPHLRNDPLIVARFKREMAAVRRIQSPHIIAVHDLVETEDVLCLVMDYHPGQDLKRRLRRDGALPFDEVLAVARQVLLGLQAAHGQGVIHRDIKPHNLLVDDEGRVKVADFGLARVDDLVGVTTHTMTLGTPEYLAPELLSSPLVDGRVDLYSLGVSLFELVTGRLPYRASSPMALLRLHQDAEVPDPRQHVPSLPRWFALQLQHAMAKEPEQRYATATEWLHALDEGAAPGAPAPGSSDSGLSCRLCGAPMLPGLRTCVECGAELVELHSVDHGGHRVYIDAVSWSQADALTFEQKYKVVAELTDLGATLKADPEQLEVRLRNLPVVVADRLSPESATRLANLLIRSGVPARPGRSGARGLLEYLMQLVRPTYVLVMLACGLALGAGMAFRATALPMFWIQSLSAGLLVSTVLAMVDVFHRRLPLARIERGSALSASDDPLLRRVVFALQAVHAPRLRSLVRRLVGRALELRQRVEQSPELRAQMRGEIDHVIARALDLAEHCARLDDELSGFQASEVYEQLQVLDERIAVAGIRETAELIEHKLELQERLASVDEKQREHVLGLNRLLHALARLTALHAEVSTRQAGAESVTSLSVLLGELGAELAAHRELEDSLRGASTEPSRVTAGSS
ncbi:MAG: protein kinase [Pseudomonadota bacterium]